MQISRGTARSRKSFSRPGRSVPVLALNKWEMLYHLGFPSLAPEDKHQQQQPQPQHQRHTVARGTFVISRACVSLLFLALETPKTAMVSVYEQLANRSKFFEDRRITKLFHRTCPADFRRKYTGREEIGKRKEDHR